MVKYCMRCGTENDAGASFCVGCGQRFPDEAGTTSSSTQAGPAPAQAQPAVYGAEMGAGPTLTC